MYVVAAILGEMTDNAINASLFYTIGTNIEEIYKELVINQIVLFGKKNEFESSHEPWGMLDGEKIWIERRSYFIREKAILLRICEVIDYFIVPLELHYAMCRHIRIRLKYRPMWSQITTQPT